MAVYSGHTRSVFSDVTAAWCHKNGDGGLFRLCCNQDHQPGENYVLYVGIGVWRTATMQ
jgi:hypothetical protein